MNDPMIGRTIGRYRIVEHLGRGGMAEVYKAYQPNLDRYVAVKMMHAFLSDEKEFLARFERESKATGLGSAQLEQLPVATTLTRLTDTPAPTATVSPTDTETATS